MPLHIHGIENGGRHFNGRRFWALTWAGLAGLATAGAVVVSTCTLCYSIAPQGREPVAYVQKTEAYQQAVCQVEAQVSQILQTSYAFPQDTQVHLTIAPKEQVQDTAELTASLMETVPQVQEAWVLTIDGCWAGACLTQEALHEALLLAQRACITEHTRSVRLLGQVELNQDYLPIDAALQTAEELAQQLLGRTGDTASALLTVETTEEETYLRGLPCPVQEQEDAGFIVGTRQVLQEGTPGQERRTDLVTCRNGVEVARENLTAETLTEPTPTLVAVGTAQGVDAAQGRFIVPTQGRLTSPFGPRTIFGGSGFHTGIDLANAIGTPIVAAADGTVSFAGTKGSYGTLLKLDHGNGFETYYAHCAKLLVPEGAWVSQGQTIALIGSTGRSTGPHLHFEVRWLGEALDPEACLPPL